MPPTDRALTDAEKAALRDYTRTRGSDRRVPRPVGKTVGQALGAVGDGPFVLNTPESAACPTCGRAGRKYSHASPSGVEVVAFIAVPHTCRPTDRPPTA